MEKSSNEVMPVKSKKVSIVVPVHNAAETLELCVESILSQENSSIECVLVENGSVDASRKLCEKLASKYRNVITASVNEKGASSARNKGLELATGDIIGFCDADDFLEPNAINKVVRGFQENPMVVAVFGGFFVEYIKDGKTVKKYRGLQTRKISLKEALRLTIADDNVMGSVWNKYYRANVLQNIRFDPSLSFCEDMHFNARALSSIESHGDVMLIHDPLYCYVQNKESITHNVNVLFDENNNLKYIVALKKIESDCNVDKITKELLKMRIACLSVDYFENTVRESEKRKKLVCELRKNYKYLLKYVNKNSWRTNVKRILHGIKILAVESKRRA